MHSIKIRSLRLAVVCASLLTACASAPPKVTREKHDAAALTVVAEIALKRGDCKGASESYANAAAVGTAASLAKRASEVALACEHLPAAWQSVNRWHALAPDDREAMATYAAVALKLYRIPEARAAITDFTRTKPPPVRPKAADVKGAAEGNGPRAKGATGTGENRKGSAAKSAAGRDAEADVDGGAADGSGGASGPGRKGAGPKAGDAAEAKSNGAGAKAAIELPPANFDLPELTALLLEHSDAATVLSAMSAGLEGTDESPDTLALLGELALESYDAQRAERYAQLALQHDPQDFAAKRVLARAYVMRGDGTRAISEARDAMSTDARRGAFELAEILSSLDRVEEAHQELDRLRNTDAPESEVNRRLALLAFNSGDLEEAGQRFSELVSSGQANDTALLFLADIAARTGDQDTALAAYRKLGEASSVALSARSRAAELLFDRKDRAGALALLDDYATAHPESEFDLTLAKARLLADHGEADAGLSLLAAALDRHPGHPSIDYDRAVILEKAGRVHESVETLEHLLVTRVDDPVLTNALGYTLADHSLELPRAETLIRRSLTVSPDSPAVLDSLGWVRYRQGDMKDAIPLLARAYSIDHDAEIAAHWGEVLWASGAHAEARKAWAAALARDPGSDALKAAVAKYITDLREHR